MPAIHDLQYSEPSLPIAQLIIFAGFGQPSGMLQPSGYQIPPPQHMHSGVGGHHSAFIPSQHLQQGIFISYKMRPHEMVLMPS